MRHRHFGLATRTQGGMTGGGIRCSGAAGRERQRRLGCLELDEGEMGHLGVLGRSWAVTCWAKSSASWAGRGTTG
jgi:hypothetical protein